MTISKNVEHSFDLSEVETGEEFLGCPKCGFKFEVGVAVKPECPECGSKMRLYVVQNAAS